MRASLHYPTKALIWSWPRGPTAGTQRHVWGRYYYFLAGSWSVLLLGLGAMVQMTHPGQRFATGLPVIGRDSRPRLARRDPYCITTPTERCGRYYYFLAGSRSVLPLRLSAMGPLTHPAQRFATGLPVIGRDSRPRLAGRDPPPSAGFNDTCVCRRCSMIFCS